MQTDQSEPDLEQLQLQLQQKIQQLQLQEQQLKALLLRNKKAGGPNIEASSFLAVGCALFAMVFSVGAIAIANSNRSSGTVVQTVATKTTEPPMGDAASGKQLFTQTCAACHGPAGKGMKGLGKNLTTSQFVSAQTNVDLLAFIKKGRLPNDPLNTTGVAMPPKGNNPKLTDAQLEDIVAYVRSINHP